ncbi:hypothetical protein LVY65_07235 [Sphingomonas sp. G124]|uniref:Uncharacterized protein n=1 Tax=Sphingomonas cremea TaxID=2904799 RepID=A0A9X1U560_9SPHN|nr:hypothetical protein [Sphingomonas cremea]MCF2514856.1 hypothetical protein [Sphingomonas cremea]
MYDHLTMAELNDGIVSGEISLEMLPKHLQTAWYAWEPEPIDLTVYALANDEHRREFLAQYCWQGESVLLVAVAHIWGSLAEPRQARCTRMGQACGAGGKGKMALVRMLRQLLAECLEYPPMPRPDQFDSLEAWHQASMQAFAAEAQREQDLYARYAAILDGRPDPAEPAATATVITGPWQQP